MSAAARAHRMRATARTDLAGLGPRSQAMLAQAGITTVTQLRRLGSVRAYAKVKGAGANASLNLLWALEGALTGLPWQVVAREHRLSLLLALETLTSPPAAAPRAPRVVRETRVRQVIRAPRSVVYRLLLNPSAIAAWKVPDGMACQVHGFEPREGGHFQVSLTYADSRAIGKSGPQTDTYQGTFLRLVPDREVVERLAFDTQDARMQGWMTIRYRLSATAAGTELLAIHGDVPLGVSLADNKTGWAMALRKLADLAQATHAEGENA